MRERLLQGPYRLRQRTERALFLGLSLGLLTGLAVGALLGRAGCHPNNLPVVGDVVPRP